MSVEPNEMNKLDIKMKQTGDITKMEVDNTFDGVEMKNVKLEVERSIESVIKDMVQGKK